MNTLCIRLPAPQLAVGHHPSYSNGEHGNNTDIIQQVEPLFWRYNVAAYFVGRWKLCSCRQSWWGWTARSGGANSHAAVLFVLPAGYREALHTPSAQVGCPSGEALRQAERPGPTLAQLALLFRAPHPSPQATTTTWSCSACLPPMALPAATQWSLRVRGSSCGALGSIWSMVLSIWPKMFAAVCRLAGWLAAGCDGPQLLLPCGC